MISGSFLKGVFSSIGSYCGSLWLLELSSSISGATFPPAVKKNSSFCQQSPEEAAATWRPDGQAAANGGKPNKSRSLDLRKNSARCK